MDPICPKLGVVLHLRSHWWIALTTDLPERPCLGTGQEHLESSPDPWRMMVGAGTRPSLPSHLPEDMHWGLGRAGQVSDQVS